MNERNIALRRALIRALLVIVAIIAVLRQPEPEYMLDDIPEGVVHNYLLALQQGYS